MNRRNFLSLSLLGATNLAFGQESRPINGQSVIFIFFSGGIAHQESFIVKPDTIESQRPINGAVATTVPGIYLGSDFPNLARRMDKLNLIHSFSHNNAGHSGGSHWVQTGKDNREVDNGGFQTWPSYGSIAARHLGSINSQALPNYIRSRSHIGDGASWLGKQFGPFDISGDSRNNLRLNVSGDLLSERQRLLSELDVLNRQIDNSGLVASMDSFEQQAFELLCGNCNQVFDLNNESHVTRTKYGASQFGQQLLLARRLVEKGVAFINIVQGSWDHHSNISQSFKTASPEVDVAISALIDDIYQRGLNEKVMIVMTSEFSRTPINGSAGRDHAPNLSPLVFSGAGVTEGAIIGEANSRIDGPKTTPITPSNLSATLLNHLGIPNNLSYIDNSGRPQHMVSAEPIRLI